MFRNKNLFRSLRRLEPISRVFGYDRGKPIDRYYIEKFLQSHRNDIRGRVLEIADNSYTQQFGTAVTKSDVLHFTAGNPSATMVADLTDASNLEANLFDCIICTQTLQSIYECSKAIGGLARMLKPGGVLLATVPGLAQISRYDMDRWGDFWRFTNLSVERLFAESFGTENVSVETFGNVLAATAFIHGMETESLKAHELEHRDQDYQILISIRAVKSPRG